MAGPIGGSGPMWQRAIWLFISCCIALAVWNAFIGSDPSGAWDRLQHKSEDVRKDAEHLGKKIEKNLPDSPGAKTTKPGDKPAKPTPQRTANKDDNR